MGSEIKYGNWNESYGFGLDKDGKMYSYCGSGTPYQFQEYQGKGIPFACQAKRQKLLLGTFDMNGSRQLKEDDVLFGIREINHSYYGWTGDIFKDYDIDILQGKKEDIYQFFEEDGDRQCVIGCDCCCGCGDW